MFTSLRTRLILLFVSLTILPLAIAATLIGRSGSDSLQQQSVTLLDQVAQRTSISLESFFNERKNELTVLTKVAGLGSVDQDTQSNLLAALLKNQPAYYQLTLANSDGQGALQLTRGQAIVTKGIDSFANDPLFKRVLSTDTIGFSQAFFDDNARDRLVTVAVPIDDLYTGTVKQVLIGELRFQPVEDAILRGLKLAQGDDVYIVDSNGTVVAHQNPSFVLKNTVFKLPTNEGRFTGLSGNDVVLAMHNLQLDALNLTVVAETSYANATAVASDLLKLSSLVTIATLLVAAIIVAFAVTRVVHPILTMAQVAETIQAGDLSQRAPVNRKDELGKLARAFNSMTDRLQQSLEGLQQHVTDLEQAKTERERLIRELREVSRLKSEFLSTMSHELRTPLNAMIGFTELMMAGVGGALSDKQTHQLSRIHANSLRLLSLIDDVLDLSRIEAGRVEIEEVAFSPREMVDKIAAQTSSLAEKKGLQFLVNVDDTLPETLVGDQARIEHIIINLLSNAFKFTEKGEVELLVTPSPASENWTLSVRDTGIGIPPHAQEYIFEEFRQVDGSSRRVYGGSGLGLAICRNTSRLMNGDVRLQSTIGQGSTFTLTLPLTVAEVSAEAALVAVPVAN